MPLIDPELKKWATSRQIEYLEAVNTHGSFAAAARFFGVHKDIVRRSMIALKRRAIIQGYAPEYGMERTVPEPFIMKNLTQHWRYDKNTGERWLEQEWTKPGLDNQMLEAAIRAACEAMAQEIPRVDPIEGPGFTRAELLNLYTVTDYHIGMAAWAQEAGADWDLRISEEMLVAAFGRMITDAPRAHSALISLLGDLLHYDGLLPVTPKSRHVLDASGRYPQIVQLVVRVLRRLVDMALMRHQHVIVEVSEGNHDEASMVWLRVLLGALYENEPRVTISTDVTPYRAFQWGTVMLGFHHSHLKKMEELPLLFAARYPKIWGDTTKRYAHTGDKHHWKGIERAGMKVIQHPTLAAPDAYAARGGWDSEREATVITYHKRYGAVGSSTITPEMLEAAA